MGEGVGGAGERVVVGLLKTVKGIFLLFCVLIIACLCRGCFVVNLGISAARYLLADYIPTTSYLGSKMRFKAPNIFLKLSN